MSTNEDKKAEGQEEPKSKANQYKNSPVPALPVSELAGSRKKDKMLHAAASQLHGWALHRHHMSREMRLTRDDYEKAIKAASHRRNGKYRPHAPALFEARKAK